MHEQLRHPHEKYHKVKSIFQLLESPTLKKCEPFNTQKLNHPKIHEIPEDPSAFISYWSPKNTKLSIMKKRSQPETQQPRRAKYAERRVNTVWEQCKNALHVSDKLLGCTNFPIKSASFSFSNYFQFNLIKVCYKWKIYSFSLVWFYLIKELGFRLIRYNLMGVSECNNVLGFGFFSERGRARNSRGTQNSGH